MAIKKLVQLSELGIPTTGDLLYTVQALQSFQVKTDRVAQTIISDYNILTENLPAGLMTSGNAEIILEGLNNAALAKIDQERVNVNWSDFVSGYFDVDGGTFYDTYVNTSTFDGGPI
jgi:hypothetical protein